MKHKKGQQPRTFVLGDLHGAFKGLLEVLRKVNFDKKYDKLIFLGDLADGWPQFPQCLEKLLTIQNLIPIIGNHDLFLKKYVEQGVIADDWYYKGGKDTIPFLNDPTTEYMLKMYFELAVFFHYENNNIFCHGGFDTKKSILKQKHTSFCFNRTLYENSKHRKFTYAKYNDNDEKPIDKIFIGHSRTPKPSPVVNGNVINLDTGAGTTGFLTIMDVNSLVFHQSDQIKRMYKNFTPEI